MTKENINKKEEGVSVFSRSAEFLEDDPLEEIFALNLGDFLTEHLISEDLAEKIKKHDIKDKAESLKKQLAELISIYSINNTLSVLGFTNKEDYIIYNSIAKTIVQMIEAKACHIFLANEYVTGMDNEESGLVLVGSSISADEEIDCDNPKLVHIPMHYGSENAGLIMIEPRQDKNLSEEFIKLIKVTATLFAISMMLQKLTDETSKVMADEEVTSSELQHYRAELTAVIGDLGEEQQNFVEMLAKAVDAKSEFHNNHSQHVADLSRTICENLGLNEKTKDLIYYAGLLQNIGKITIPEELFNKKEKLSKEDWETLQNHPNIGVSLLMSINFLSEVIPYIHYHKERWDGKGAPDGLKGYSIPLGSRIIAIADAYCALREDRSYRKAKTQEESIAIIKEESGIKWDPELVNILDCIICKRDNEDK